MNIILGYACYTGYKLLTSALSDIFCLHTLRHGTCLTNFIGIQLLGIRPDLGGRQPGEAVLQKYAGNGSNEGRFFVWVDEFYKPGFVNHPCAPLVRLINCKRMHPLVKTLGPRYYAALSGAASFTIRRAPQPLRIFLQVIGGLVGILTPTIDIHCTQGDLQDSFIVDPCLVPAARYTSKPLKPWKFIGLSGVLVQGVNKELFQRISDNPLRCLKGLIKLALLAALIASIVLLFLGVMHIAAPLTLLGISHIIS